MATYHLPYTPGVKDRLEQLKYMTFHDPWLFSRRVQGVELATAAGKAKAAEELRAASDELIVIDGDEGQRAALDALNDGPVNGIGIKNLYGTVVCPK